MDNLFEQATNISKAHAYDIVAKQRDELVKEVEQLKRNMNNNCLLALEFGYKQCEKGNNIEMAFINYNKIINQ